MLTCALPDGERILGDPQRAHPTGSFRSYMKDVPRWRIAVAIIERDGKILVAQRKAESPFPNLWELPGGRCRDGEEPARCVVREVKEETGLSVRPEAPAGLVEHSYPECTVEIHAFFCSILDGEAQPLESQSIVWIGWEEIEKYEFPEANKRVFLEARRLRALWRRASGEIG